MSNSITNEARSGHDRALGSIMVATDLSPGAAKAVLWAAETADRAGAALIPAMAYGESWPETPPDEMAAHRQSVITEIEGELESLGLAALGAEPTAAFGHAQEVLPRLADEHEADLLVVGTRGGGGFADLRLGSVSNHLLHHTRLPLAVVPPSTVPRPDGPVLVGVDGSTASAAALGWAIALASLIRAPLAAVYVHDPLVGPARYPWLEPSGPAREERAARRLVADHPGPTGEAIDVVRVDAPTVEGLTTFAAELDAFALVVGARRTDRLGGRLLSRVPNQLTHHSEHPVVVIRE